MRSKCVCLALLILIVAAECLAQRPSRAGQPKPGYGQMPLAFEANQGQTDPQVKFVSRGRGYTAFLTTGGIVLSLRSNEATSADTLKNGPSAREHPTATLHFKLVGAAPNPSIIGEDPQPGRVNYFIGNDPTKWQRNVPTYGRVRLKNIYPGIDLVYYGNHRQLEYDFDLSPGANPNSIKFEIEGSQEITVDTGGDLVLKTAVGELRFQSPAVYQESLGSRVPLQGTYVLESPTRVGFHVVNADPGKPLVIDPTLIYSSYLGGSGIDQTTGIAVDGSGSVYVSGYTDSADFPLATLGSLPPGNDHVFVAKFDPTGSTLVYSDYIGGNGWDYGYALTLDSANEVWVTGSTASSNFPVVNPYQGTYPGSLNAFLTKISSDGSNLLYSTYLGGNSTDIPTGVALDGQADVLIAGYTSSLNFPVVNAFQSTVYPNGGGYYGVYGFVTKFSPDGSSLVYSTYFAGNSNVAYNCGGTCWGQPSSTIQSLATDANGDAYIAGTTNTYNFPTTPGVYQTTNSTQLNQQVGFVAKLSSAGTLDYSTYFYESSGYTQISGLAVDALGSPYVTGLATSNGLFPITSTSICDPSVYGAACSYAFVTKFDPSAATLLYSTFLGPNNYASPAAIALDQNNDAYVLATTSSTSFAGVNAIEPYAGGNDILLVEIDPAASSQLFATYFGGTANESASGMTLDPSGNIWITGTTLSTDLPTTPGAFQLQPGGSTDAFVIEIGSSSAPSVSLNPYALQFASQQIGTTSQAQQVLLRNVSSGPLTISSITTTSDFAETDNCGNNVAAAANCSLSVTFTPSAPGLRTGSIVISDNATGSPHSVQLTGTGLGGVALLTPGSMTFPSVPVGASSSAQVVTLTNQGNASLNIGSIQTTGDFAQTNNCPSSLTAGANCSLNVTFSPTAAGNRTGSLSITDDALGSPQSVALSGTGLGAVLSLTPTNLTFPSTQVGTSSATQTVALLNQGNVSLSISNIQILGDYLQTNSCPSSLASGATCSVNVTFAPTVSGTRSGALTISDNAPGSPQVIQLSGAGSDFSLTSTPTSVTVKAGSVAFYNLTANPIGGAFNSSIKLSCTGAPAKSTCSISSLSVTPGANGATVTLVVATTAPTAMAMLPYTPNRMGYAMWMHIPGVGVFAIFIVGSKRWRKKSSMLVVLVLMIPALLFLSACAGGTGIVPTGSGTTPGTYNFTVTGASGGLQHSLPLTLIVQ